MRARESPDSHAIALRNTFPNVESFTREENPFYIGYNVESFTPATNPSE